jgi:NAD(P)H-dependent FMN reductase
MIVIVQGSNRKGNLTRPFVEYAADYLNEKGEACVILDLEHLPSDVLHSEMYAEGEEHYFLDQAAAEMRKAGRWIFAFPEYNGSYPGGLKVFIDALSVRDYKTLFGGKTAGLIGTSSGRAGNLRGLDHFNGVLNHLGTTVMPQSLPMSMIDALIDEGGNLTNEAAQKSVSEFLDRFLAYTSEHASVNA